MAAVSIEDVEDLTQRFRAVADLATPGPWRVIPDDRAGSYRRSGVVVEAPQPAWWHTSPTDFATLAGQHGFRVDGTWSCREMTGDTFYSLQDRFSCLLAR